MTGNNVLFKDVSRSYYWFRFNIAAENLDEIKIIFLEEEIVELKKSLKDEKQKNHYMQQLLEAAEKDKHRRQ